jgi:DNA replication protein DnaC
MEDATDETETAVRVFARLRPAATSVREEHLSVPRRFGQQKHVQVRNLEFSLDWVFDEDATQDDVFEMVGDGVSALLQGYHCLVLAYGQTGSGKTHTIFGPQRRC